MADTIVVLNRGRIEQMGPPMELYHRPRTEFVADFIGAPAMNFLSVRAQDGGIHYNGDRIETPPVSTGTPVKLGIRPEHIGVAQPGSGAFDARVEVKEALGGESYLYVNAPGGERIVVKTDGDDATKHGDTIALSLPSERLHLFAESGENLTLERTDG